MHGRFVTRPDQGAGRSEPMNSWARSRQLDTGSPRVIATTCSTCRPRAAAISTGLDRTGIGTAPAQQQAPGLLQGSRPGPVAPAPRTPRHWGGRQPAAQMPQRLGHPRRLVDLEEGDRPAQAAGIAAGHACRHAALEQPHRTLGTLRPAGNWIAGHRPPPRRASRAPAHPQSRPAPASSRTARQRRRSRQAGHRREHAPIVGGHTPGRHRPFPHQGWNSPSSHSSTASIGRCSSGSVSSSPSRPTEIVATKPIEKICDC